MKKALNLKILAMIFIMAMMVAGPGCNSNGNGGGGAASEIAALPPASINQGSVENIVSGILDLISPFGRVNLALGGDFVGGEGIAFSPPQPQAEMTVGCMKITYPANIETANSFEIIMEMNNCDEDNDQVYENGMIKIKVTQTGDYSFSLEGTIDTTEGSEFIKLSFDIDTSMSGMETSMDISLEGSLSNPDNPSETIYADISQTVSVDPGESDMDVDDDVYTVGFSGKIGSTIEGKIEVEASELLFSSQVCEGLYPYDGTITVENGSNTATVTISSDPCGTGNLSIDGTDMGQVDLV